MTKLKGADMKKELLYFTFSNIPKLTTERLLLRKMKVSDAADMFEYSRLRNVTKYLTWNPHPNINYTEEYLRYISTRYATGDFYDWAVTLKENGKMIGTCGFTRFDLTNNSAEIGYVLNPAYHGKGYATEAAREVMRFGFDDLKLHRIEARHMLGNDASHKVMEKLGMTEEGTFRESYYVKREYRTVTVCAILESEYRNIEE